MRTTFVSLCSILFLAIPATHAAVITVDAAGGGDHTSINAAIAAAANDDILLVQSGDYRPIDVFGVVANGKALVIVGAGPTRPILNRLEIKNIPAAKSFVVRGLEIRPAVFAPSVGGLWLSTSPGTLLVENCMIRGGEGSAAAFGIPLDGSPAVDAVNSTFAAFTRCTMVGCRGIDAVSGGPNQHGSTRGGTAVRLQFCPATLYDCAAVGGDAGDGPPHSFMSSSGGHGAVTFNALRASGCSFTGGAGGDAQTPNLADAGVGGDGVRVAQPATFETIASTSAGGPGGMTTTGAFAAAGVAEQLWQPSAHVVIPTNARHFELSSPVVELTPVTVSFGGTPGEFVFLLQSFSVGHTQIGGTLGWMSIAPPYNGPFLIGTVGPSGNTSFTVNAPPISPPTLEGAVFLFEAIFANPNEIVVGPPSAFVLLHS